jgi:hypothetical protein
MTAPGTSPCATASFTTAGIRPKFILGGSDTDADIFTSDGNAKRGNAKKTDITAIQKLFITNNASFLTGTY